MSNNMYIDIVPFSGKTRGRKLKETVLNEIITINVDIENTINV